MDKNNIYVLVLLILSLVMTATLVLTLVKNAKNQEFKERTLILTEEKNDVQKVQYTICQWKKTKIEIETCLFENGVKKECSLEYPGYDLKYKDEEFINLLDALEIQPGDTVRIKMEDLEPDILAKFGYLLEEEEGEGEGGEGGEGGEVCYDCWQEVLDD